MGSEDICGAALEREVRIFGGGDIWEVVVWEVRIFRGEGIWEAVSELGGEDISG